MSDYFDPHFNCMMRVMAIGLTIARIEKPNGDRYFIPVEELKKLMEDL